MQLSLKRLVVWLLESLVEGFLLGCLLGGLSMRNFIGVLQGGIVSSYIIFTVLFMYGYYVTTALSGLFWRSRRWWLYPAIAATLFVIHMHIAYAMLKTYMSPEARAMELPFLAGGACIVFACRFFGGWCLRKWIGDGRREAVAGRAVV